jgi:hypothetical protein
MGAPVGRVACMGEPHIMVKIPLERTYKWEDNIVTVTKMD